MTRNGLALGAPHYSSIRRICTGSTVDSIVCEFSNEALFTKKYGLVLGGPKPAPLMPTHPAAGLPSPELHGKSLLSEPQNTIYRHPKRWDIQEVSGRDSVITKMQWICCIVTPQTTAVSFCLIFGTPTARGYSKGGEAKHEASSAVVRLRMH